jgi:DNA-3-methyladenine glycosylase I
MNNPGIVRNRLKIEAAIKNAQGYLHIQETHGSFSRYLWSIVGGKPITNAWTEISQLPATTPESITLSKNLKSIGFNFVGPTICYAFMQAVGMVNDHTVDCFRYRQILDLYE